MNYIKPLKYKIVKNIKILKSVSLYKNMKIGNVNGKDIRNGTVCYSDQ